MKQMLMLLTVIAMGLPAQAQTDPGAGMVGHWAFDEGAGPIVHDRSGHGHDGKIVGAVWERTPQGAALRCDGSGDYVDCGNPDGLRLTGDLSVAVWVKLRASPYPDYNTNWYVVDCEEYNKSGWMLRIDGYTATLCFRTSQDGSNRYGFSNAVLANNAFHHVAAVRQDRQVTLYVDAVADITFQTLDPLPPTVPFRIGQAGQSLSGLYDDVRVYDRALTSGEVLRLYKAGAASRGKDTSWFNRIILRPFFRFARKEVIVDADLRGILPLDPGTEVVAELRDASGKPVSSQPLADLDTSCRCDITFSLEGLPPGRHEVLVSCKGGTETATERVAFQYPPPPPTVAAPAQATVPALPSEPGPVAFDFQVTEGGGLLLTVGEQEFTVESQFSYPHGGDNALVCGAPPEGMEKSWRTESRRLDAGACETLGEGRTYSITRRVRRLPNRLVVTDTILNKTGDSIGILAQHRLQIGDRRPKRAWLAGRSCSGTAAAKPIKTNPTIFMDVGGLGLGLIALDDVLIVQARGAVQQNGCVLQTDEFALDAGASYALEWAVYLNSTGDYYDFVNQVRRDEGRNSVIVEGGFGVPYLSAGRRAVPTSEYLDMRGAKYVISSCLAHIADDPDISIEGLGFMYYPKEKELMREQMLGIRAVAPRTMPMFHVAHSLFITNRPEETFPDSRVIQADGTQAVWEDPGHRYISKERQEAGWRWWIYYPTLDNSFGKALLESVDVMVDEMGCRGVFMDGFMWGYRGEYTYDRWDDHTADIDPKTKTIKRKKGSVLLLSQPALMAFVERMRAKGAVVIANNAVITRTVGRLDIIVDKEITEGPDVHLAQTPITMGNAPKITNAGDVYRDVRNKLAWGNLYMYYGEGEITHPSVPQQMYPITVQEVGEGLVKGRERLVTSRSGVYGWRDSGDLHFVHLYDGRGFPVDHGFLTTADAEGVRTQVDLGEDETAVVKRIPLAVASPSPVNILARKYGPAGVELLLNGEGPARLTIRDGAFPVQPGGEIRVRINGEHTPASVEGDSLTIPLELRGQRVISVSRIEATG